jgi:hypothetical protein
MVLQRLPMITIVLDEYQRLIAEQYGAQRARNFLPHFNGQTNTNYVQQINGGDFEAFVNRQVLYVAAEIAVAEYFGLTDYMPSNSAYKDEADVGANIEVKYTHRREGDLLIRHRDRDSDYGVLVIGDINAFIIVGWYPIKEAKTEAYGKHHLPGCYLVPKAQLKPMDSLEMIGDTAYERVNTL